MNKSKPLDQLRLLHLSALVSPWIRLPELAREFLSSKDRPEWLQTFVNLVLGESWDETRESSTIGLDLYERREKLRPVPQEVLLLTAGTDVQDDRLEPRSADGAGRKGCL